MGLVYNVLLSSGLATLAGILLALPGGARIENAHSFLKRTPETYQSGAHSADSSPLNQATSSFGDDDSADDGTDNSSDFALPLAAALAWVIAFVLRFQVCYLVLRRILIPLFDPPPEFPLPVN